MICLKKAVHTASQTPLQICRSMFHFWKGCLAVGSSKPSHKIRGFDPISSASATSPIAETALSKLPAASAVGEAASVLLVGSAAVGLCRYLSPDFSFVQTQLEDPDYQSRIYLKCGSIQVITKNWCWLLRPLFVRFLEICCPGIDRVLF